MNTINYNYNETRKNSVRINLLILTFISSIFLPYFRLNNVFFLEWGILLSIYAVIDMFFLLKEPRKIDNLSKKIIYFIYFNIFLIIVAIGLDYDYVTIGLLHFGRAASMLIIYIWMYLFIDNSTKLKIIRIFEKIVLVLPLFIIIDDAFFQLFTVRDHEKLSLVNMGKNALGYYLITGLAFILSSKKIKIIHKLFYIISTFISVFFTQSTTAFLYICLLIAIWLWGYQSVLTMRNISLSILTAMLGLIITPILIIKSSNITQLQELREFFFSSINGGLLESSESLRFNTQLLVFEDMNLEMILGRYYYYFFTIRGVTLHNLYLQMFYDTGIIGFLLFSWMWYCIINKFKKTEKLFIILILSYSLIENFFFSFLPLMIIFLMIIRSDNNAKNSKEKLYNKL